MLFGVPRPWIEAPLPTKPIELSRGKVFCHRITHSPGEQLHSIGGKGDYEWLEVVKGRNSTTIEVSLYILT